MLDTSVLPKRPSIADLKQFLDGELKLDMTLVKSIQTHNVKNVVYLIVHCEEVAARIATNHHMKHYMSCDGKRQTIPLPIYIDSSAVDVRLHDLPEEIDINTITRHMQQYGEVISIRNDVWRSYFPGLSNGIRVIRMKLTQAIPSYITISEEVTYVSHFSQMKTCRNCGRKEHPKLRCSEAAAPTSSNPQSLRPIKLNEHQNQPALLEEQWPSLSKPETIGTNIPKKQTHHKPEPKRQRSMDSDQDTASNHIPKRVAPHVSVSTSNESDSSVVVSDASPVRARNGRRRGSFSHIDDPVLRQQYIEEEAQRIEELYRQGYRI